MYFYISTFGAFHVEVLFSVCVCVCVCVCVQLGCPTLLLAIDCPAKFSSNSNQTHLKQLIKVFRITWKLKTGVFD